MYICVSMCVYVRLCASMRASVCPICVYVMCVHVRLCVFRCGYVCLCVVVCLRAVVCLLCVLRVVVCGCVRFCV